MEHIEIIGDSPENEQNIKFLTRYPHFIFQIIKQIISNFNSWTYPYWLFFFFVIPIIILIIGMLSTVLTKGFFNEFFVLNQSYYLSTAFYLNHFTHIEISHLSTNLLLYLLSVFVIFTIEENRKRIIFCSVIFFTIVPIFGSYLTLQIWEISHSVNGQNYGFSAISLAFFGYALYLGIKWLYSTVLISFWLKSSEKKLFISLLQNFSFKAKTTLSSFIQNLGFFIQFCLFFIIMGYTIRFGFEAGQYLQTNGTTSNGIGHFLGLSLGLIAPIIYSIIFEKTERIFDSIYLCVIVIGIWNYYSAYLAPSLHL